MRRGYFLVPNIEVSKKIVDALLLALIKKHHPDADCGTEPEITVFP